MSSGSAAVSVTVSGPACQVEPSSASPSDDEATVLGALVSNFTTHDPGTLVLPALSMARYS